MAWFSCRKDAGVRHESGRIKGQMQVKGVADRDFEAVKEAFAALFDSPQERGAALCVQVGGEDSHKESEGDG